MVGVVTAASIDLRQLADDLAHASGQGIEQVATQLIHETAQKVQQYAAAAAPRDTGRLAGSITIRWISKLEAEVSPTVPYGVYQEFGTASRGEFRGQPYEIRPKSAKALVFQVNGRTVFARKVIHPGVKAQPYMRPAAIQALEPFAGQLADRGQLLIIKGPGSTL